MKNRTFQSLKLFIGIFLILHVLCPIIALATHISYGDISEVLSSAQLPQCFGIHFFHRL